jgi:uncharacterized protein (UPF0332 family)
LINKDIEVKSHNGVKQKLGEEFVLKGVISKEFVRTYSVLADYRHKGDNDDLFDFDEEVIRRLLVPVKEYIEKIEKIIGQ